MALTYCKIILIQVFNCGVCKKMFTGATSGTRTAYFPSVLSGFVLLDL